MGLWNFIKDAGKAIGIGGDEAPDADALKKEVADLGLDASGVDIETDGDTVKVSGKSLTQELREKIVWRSVTLQASRLSKTILRLKSLRLRPSSIPSIRATPSGLCRKRLMATVQSI